MRLDEAIRLAATRAPLDQLVQALRESGRDNELQALLDEAKPTAEMRHKNTIREKFNGGERIVVQRTWVEWEHPTVRAGDPLEVGPDGYVRRSDVAPTFLGIAIGPGNASGEVTVRLGP